MFSKFNKISATYVAFGLGTIFGSIIASTIGTFIYQITTGNEHAAEILKITECLEERVDK